MSEFPPGAPSDSADVSRCWTLRDQFIWVIGFGVWCGGLRAAGAPFYLIGTAVSLWIAVLIFAVRRRHRLAVCLQLSTLFAMVILQSPSSQDWRNEDTVRLFLSSVLLVSTFVSFAAMLADVLQDAGPPSIDSTS